MARIELVDFIFLFIVFLSRLLRLATKQESPCIYRMKLCLVISS
jgi:hypothetical protein